MHWIFLSILGLSPLLTMLTFSAISVGEAAV